MFPCFCRCFTKQTQIDVPCVDTVYYPSGINYTGQQGELRGCQNDVLNVSFTFHILLRPIGIPTQIDLPSAFVR